MHRHAVAVFVMLSVTCHFSYHVLLSLKYENCTVKTAAAKRLAEEKGISVREAERQLNMDAYLQEHQQWVPSGLHHQFLLQWMFLHAVAMGYREYNCAIHQDRQETISGARPEGRSHLL